MKKLTILCLLCLASMGAMAKSLVLTLSDGTLVYYLLGGETDPRMRFVEGKIEVNTDVYQISGIKNFYISNEDDPVGSHLSLQSSPLLNFIRFLILSGLISLNQKRSGTSYHLPFFTTFHFSSYVLFDFLSTLTSSLP